MVVTGHSLGAGVAVLVAMYVRQYFSDVFCWAFSPPGGLAEPSVAHAAQSFCTSVALGKDWIPRLTLGSFEHLRDQMVGHFNLSSPPHIVSLLSDSCHPYTSLVRTSTSPG